MSDAGTLLYHGKVLRLVRERHLLANGHAGDYEIVRHSGGAAVLPLHADGRVVLVRQFRPAVAGEVLEIPAGRLDPGEDPAVCARRELAEETGLRAARLDPLGAIWTTVGFCDERLHLFLARDLTPGPQDLEAGESLTLVELPLTEALALLAAGELPDAKTQLALLHAARLLGVPAP